MRLRKHFARLTSMNQVELDRWPLLRLDWFGSMRPSSVRRSAGTSWLEIEALFSPIIECLPEDVEHVSRFPAGFATCLSGAIVRRWVSVSHMRRYQLNACYSNDPDAQDGVDLVRHAQWPKLVGHGAARQLHCRIDLRTSQVELQPANALENGQPILKTGIYSSIRDRGTLLYVVTNDVTKRRLIAAASDIVALCFTPRGSFLCDMLQGKYIGKSTLPLTSIRFDGLRFVHERGLGERKVDEQAVSRNQRLAEEELQKMVDRAMRSYQVSQEALLGAMIPAREPVEISGTCLTFDDAGYTNFLMLNCWGLSLATGAWIEGFEVPAEFLPVEV